MTLDLKEFLKFDCKSLTVKVYGLPAKGADCGSMSN